MSKSNKNKTYRSIILLFCLLMFTAIYGCSTGVEDTGSSSTTPAGYNIALTADLASLTAGNSTVVTATVTDGAAKAVSGLAVTFTLLVDNSAATLTTISGTTDASGKAVAVYTAGVANPTTSVQDTIRAAVTGSSRVVIITRTAAGGGGGTGVQMTVTATPSSVVAGAMSVIVAQVNNAAATAVSGLTVTFTFLINNSGATLTTVNATTDTSGKAIASYAAGGNSPGLSIQDAVTASVTGSAGTAIITRLPATGTGNRISLTLTPVSTPDAPLATTASNCIVTATVLRDDGVTPVPGEEVSFSIVKGSGSIAPLKPLTDTTNNSGKANAVFTAPGGATGFEAVVRAEILNTTNGGDAVSIIYW